LQQCLRHLQGAFTSFFEGRAKYPRFKSRKSAEYTSSAFRCRDGRLTLAKMREPLAVVWSRPLPEDAAPSTVTVSQDAAVMKRQMYGRAGFLLLRGEYRSRRQRYVTAAFMPGPNS
jgi:hypothetical protein